MRCKKKKESRNLGYLDLDLRVPRRLYCYNIPLITRNLLYWWLNDMSRDPNSLGFRVGKV